MSTVRVEVPGYTEETIGNARILVRETDRDFVKEALEWAGTLYEYAAKNSEARKVDGRTTAYVIPGAESGRWLVRHLTHGGALAPITGDRFLSKGTPRPFNEVRLASQLAEWTVRTPPVRAAVVYPSGPFYRGDVARAWIDHSRDLASCLFGDPPLTENAIEQSLAAAGKLVRILHGVGLEHADLNLRNVLIHFGPDGPVGFILDLEKCTLVPRVSDRRRKVMLDRLARSLDKTAEREGRTFNPKVWDVLMDSYYSTGGRA